MRIFDLSGPIRDGADWYHEKITPPVRLEDIGSIEKEGWVSHTLTIQVLNGTTYLETPAHLFADGLLLNQVPPEKLICKAHVVRLPGDKQELPAPDHGLGDFQSGRDALLLHCGWDAHYNQPDFYNASPYFSKPLQEWILDHNPSILGGDMTSFDHPTEGNMPFLHAYFKRGGMILCPLVGLAAIPHDIVTLCAAPLKLMGANAAPCRVLAWV